MSVGLLLVCHNNIGNALIDTALSLMETIPLEIRVVNVYRDSAPEYIVELAKDAVEQMDAGEGVLILTDLFGATPSNIAAKLYVEHRVAIIAGLNLPMLIRTLNYPMLDLDLLAEKAYTGGKDGILMYRTETSDHD